MEVIIDGVKYVQAPVVPTGKGLLDALELRFDSDAGDGLTIRDYLHKLLLTLWEEGEGFSGKRPFGNSGWDFDLYIPLIKNGFIAGRLAADGYIEKIESEEDAIEYVSSLIAAVFYGVKSE
jgi:hypothetical protein